MSHHPAEKLDLAALANLDTDAVRCPHSIYASMRQSSPIVFAPEFEAWVVTRYADMVEVTRRTDVFSNQYSTGPTLARQRLDAVRVMAEREPELAAELGQLRGGARVLVFADPPDHSRQRRLVNRAFAPAQIAALEPRIREITNSLIDTFIETGHVELVSQFASPLPLMVIAEMLGVPVEDLPKFKKWSDAAAKGIGNAMLSPEQTRKDMLTQYEFFTYFADAVAERRARPCGDLISLVIEATIEDEPLSDPDVLNMMMAFVLAGNETTTTLITSAIKILLQDKALLHALRQQPDKIEDFVEEALRLEAPVQCSFRTALVDTTLAGVQITAGEHVMLVWSSGNRDDTKYSDPDEVNLERVSQPPHLAFGKGAHHCLGATLARTEARIAIEVLLSRLSQLSPSEGTDLEHLRYIPSYMLHGPSELNLTFELESVGTTP